MIIKKLISVVTIILLLLPLQVWSQSLLWKISGNGTSSSSYLYGTIHIQDRRVFEWPEVILSKIDECSMFSGELNLTELDMNETTSLFFLPDGETLSDIFTPQEYQMIREALQKCSGMDISLFERVKPVTLVAVCLTIGKEGDMDAPVDDLLMRYAGSHQKTIRGIETIEEQMQLLDKIPNEYVVEFFRNMDQQQAEMEKLIRIYQKADLDSIYIVMQEEESGALLNDELIQNRNYIMAERTIPWIKEQSVFIAVGAGHLPGEEGLINLYRKEGFKVEPVEIR